MSEKTGGVTVSDIAREIGTIANRRGEDAQVTWDRWLEWMCEGFDAKHVVCEGVVASLERMMNDNGDFFGIMHKWFEVAYSEMKREPGFDAFGTIYEEAFKSKWKASHTGQFFTPMHICRLMARICGEAPVGDDGIVRYNDPAVGSGRTMLAAWNCSDRYAKNFFDAGDVDATSVRMCALNFMINGMVGCVSLEDALSLEWRFGYVVNACKVPFANNTSCVEFFDDRERFNQARARLLELMKDWDIGNYRKYSAEQGKIEEKEKKDSCAIDS